MVAYCIFASSSFPTLASATHSGNTDGSGCRCLLLPCLLRPLSPALPSHDQCCLCSTAALPAALCITLFCATTLWTWLLLQAILLVQQNKTTAALEVLEPLFEHIEPMQENVAIRVCLLLMELYLSSSNYAQAASKLFLLHCILAEQQNSQFCICNICNTGVLACSQSLSLVC